MGRIIISIVSHGHSALLPGLMDDLATCPEIASVIVTRNIPDPNCVEARRGYLSVIENPRPQGFAANHNAAFRHVRTPYFAVLNPDVRLNGNPFPTLLSCMEDDRVALCAPAVTNPDGALEDSARRFPSPFDIARKAIGRYDGRVSYGLGDPPRAVPWVAGMFMLMRSANFAAIGGFDENFFLYYEDVDLCARLWSAGQKVMLCPEVHIVHDARRASRHNLRHMRWHAASMARYFRKHGKGPDTSRE